MPLVRTQVASRKVDVHVRSMNDSRVMSLGQKLGELGNGKRTAIILLAVLLVSALIGVVVFGFRGRHIRRNSAAMVAPVPKAAQPVTPGSPAARSPVAH